MRWNFICGVVIAVYVQGIWNQHMQIFDEFTVLDKEGFMPL